MAESEEELKNLLMKMKEESEKTGFKLKILKSLAHSIQSYHFMANRWGRSGNNDRLFSWATKFTVDGDCSHEIKRCLFLGRKTVTNLDSVLKSRDSFFFFLLALAVPDSYFYKKLCTFLQHNPRDRSQRLPPPWRPWPIVLLWWRNRHLLWPLETSLENKMVSLENKMMEGYMDMEYISLPLSVDTSGIHLQTQKCMQNTS